MHDINRVFKTLIGKHYYYEPLHVPRGYLLSRIVARHGSTRAGKLES